MRKKLQGLVLVLSFLLLLPFCITVDRSVAYAATPSFTETKLEIEGTGQTHQLTIQNQVANSKYKWYSSKAAVAKVNSKGIITTVSKGTATISCKITYPNGNTKTLKCNVTITIPASEVKINNATLVNGAHILMLGDSFDFNRDIYPTNSSDKTFWSIGGGDSACIRVDDDTKGKITATKPGKVILVATAAKTATEKDAAKSIVNDAIIIEVVGPTATVKSIDMPDSTQLKIDFDCEIDENSVIDSKSKLRDTISVTMKSDTKGVMATDPGALTAKLSADKRSLIISPENSFAGIYGVSVSDKVKAASGLSMEAYYKQIDFVDTTPPKVVSITTDDSGFVGIITFSEAMNFAGLKVTAPTVISSSGNSLIADPYTLNILSSKLNYIASKDNKSLRINMSNIVSSDYDKTFSVVLSGITDMAGNAPENYIVTIVLRVDNLPRPQAKPLYMLRTGYNILTVYYDRAIQTPGYAVINGNWMPGTVDTTDNKVVNYTISEEDALRTGNQIIGVVAWSGYNVASNDMTAGQINNLNCNFTVDSTSPVLLTYDYKHSSKELTLIYNKEVSLLSEEGILYASLMTATGDRYSSASVAYKKLASDDKKTIKLLLDNMQIIGEYTINFHEGFVYDNFRNRSVTKNVIINTTGNGGEELPIPYSIMQNPSEPNEIFIFFANKIDEASASNTGNYSIAGVPIISARVLDNTSETGAKIVLTVPEDSISVSLERPITIANIAGFNGSYKPMTAYTKDIMLTDNVKAKYISATYDKAAGNRIVLKFSEDIQGTVVLKVTQVNNGYSIEEGHSTYIVGSDLYISLNSMPSNGSYIRFDLISNLLTDASGNKVTMPQSGGVVVQY